MRLFSLLFSAVCVRFNQSINEELKSFLAHRAALFIQSFPAFSFSFLPPLFLLFIHSLCTAYWLLLFESTGLWSGENVKISRKRRPFFSAQRALPCPAEVVTVCIRAIRTHTWDTSRHLMSLHSSLFFFHLSPEWWLATSTELDKGDLVFPLEYINSRRAGGPKWPWPNGAKLNARGRSGRKWARLAFFKTTIISMCWQHID